MIGFDILAATRIISSLTGLSLLFFKLMTVFLIAKHTLLATGYIREIKGGREIENKKGMNINSNIRLIELSGRVVACARC